MSCLSCSVFSRACDCTRPEAGPDQLAVCGVSQRHVSTRCLWSRPLPTSLSGVKPPCRIPFGVAFDVTAFRFSSGTDTHMPSRRRNPRSSRSHSPEADSLDVAHHLSVLAVCDSAKARDSRKRSRHGCQSLSIGHRSGLSGHGMSWE